MSESEPGPDAPRRWGAVWVVGASSGIGRALVHRLEGRARSIAVSARSADELEALSRACPSAVPYALDVTDAGAVKDAAQRIEREQGPIDLAVLSFGVWHYMGMEDFDLEKASNGVQVNYVGALNVLDALLPGMLARRSGRLAIIASVAGYRGFPKAVAYGPTKAALINLAETLNVELGRHGISVSVINPGFVDTPMTRDNPFPMPSKITAEEAADYIVRGLERNAYEIVFPPLFAAGMKLLRAMPNALYFWFVRSFIHPGRRK